MAGTNPYIEEEEATLPTTPYKITFVFEETGERHEIRVDPDKIPYGETGRIGSILDVALAAGLDIDHACGGVCACSTCHVIVKEGLETTNEASEDEEDQLDNAPGLTHQSRLSCQCIPDGTKDVVVEIPRWNRNNVQEGT